MKSNPTIFSIIPAASFLAPPASRAGGPAVPEFGPIRVKRMLLTAVLLVFPFFGLSAQTLEETLGWLDAKIDDTTYQQTNDEHFFSLEDYNASTGKITIKIDWPSMDQYVLSSFFLSDIETVNVRKTSCYEISLIVKNWYKFVEEDHYSYGDRTPHYRSETTGITFYFTNESMANRIVNAFRHAIEVAPPSPNAAEDEIF